MFNFATFKINRQLPEFMLFPPAILVSQAAAMPAQLMHHVTIVKDSAGSPAAEFGANSKNTRPQLIKSIPASTESCQS
jgi:hypothetical protein